MDNTVGETHGKQEGSAYNGYFGCECYHPRFCFNQCGDGRRLRVIWGIPEQETRV